MSRSFSSPQQKSKSVIMGVELDRNNRFLICLLFVIILALALPQNASAKNCSKDIRINNMLGNALFTLVFRSVNGEVRNWADVGESLTFGASAGYLFYKSRELIGRGDESRGIATAYLASSLSDNVSKGYHPLSHLRYGIGPTEVKWRTPFAGGGKHHLSFSLNAIDTLGMVSLLASGQAGNFTLRNGVVIADDFGAVNTDFSAYTMNRTIVMKAEHSGDQGLWHHELIHTTQYLQYSSFGSDRFDVVDWEKIDRFGIRDRVQKTGLDLNLRVEWFNTVISSLDRHHDYQHRNREIEAARLGQNTSPLHDDSDHACTAQVGFQFEF